PVHRGLRPLEARRETLSKSELLSLVFFCLCPLRVPAGSLLQASRVSDPLAPGSVEQSTMVARNGKKWDRDNLVRRRRAQPAVGREVSREERLLSELFADLTARPKGAGGCLMPLREKSLRLCAFALISSGYWPSFRASLLFCFQWVDDEDGSVGGCSLNISGLH
ncbi:MAG: hypothetical protein K8R59_17495, partial [Thermoanaerobaculales bacterium]|nr:hypothetical protein [Thermoanaerobaculales bacterium]